MMDWKNLYTATSDEMRQMGMCVWDTNEQGTLWLIPHAQYADIPEGLELESILGQETKFQPGVTDDDQRGGFLAYGIRRVMED